MTTLAHPAWPDRSASVLGWTVSLLAHAVVVAWLLHAWNAGDRPRDAADAVPARRIEVRLVPLRPPPSRTVEAAAPSVVASAASPARPRRPVAHADDDAHVHADADRDAAAPVRPRAVPAPPRTRAPVRAPEADAPASTIAVTPAQPAERQATPAAADAAAPRVDLAAARSAARQFGREGGKSLVALPERRLVVEPNADRRVVDPLEAARRIDCQTARAQSTNLLANVVMLAVDLTKNAIDDSGCKW